MLPTTHLLSALALSKYTGHSVPILLGSLLIDLDHIYYFFKHRERKGGLIPAALELFHPHPEFDECRTRLHSLLWWFIISVIIYLITPTFGIYFSIGYLLHLILDTLDTTSLELFHPHKYNVIGVVEFNSLMEYLFGIVLFIIYFWF